MPLTITPSDVLRVAGPQPILGKIGTGPIVAGDIVTILSNLVEIADTDTEENAGGSQGSNSLYIALSNGSTGQPISLARPKSTIYLNAGDISKPYFLGPDGAIVEYDDLTTDEYVSILGIIDADNNLYFNPIISGTQIP